VVRSTWDYSDRRDAFLAWCARPPRLLNPAAVIEWNTDKRYLRELEVAGIPIVPTTWISPGQEPTGMPAGQVVVKPSVSAGARNTSRYERGDQAAARAHVERLLSEGRTVLLQPYVESVDVAGETGLIYIDGVLSHTIRKGPVLHAPGFATDRLWAPEEISVRAPDGAERAIAEAALDSLPWPRGELLYARVDLVRGDDGRPMLLELELAEPSLFLGLEAGAPERLAAGIARRLGNGGWDARGAGDGRRDVAGFPR
jgi:glutathione synthase/RimK-type ligase-like ATP-grasp enzyme